MKYEKIIGVVLFFVCSFIVIMVFFIKPVGHNSIEIGSFNVFCSIILSAFFTYLVARKQ